MKLINLVPENVKRESQNKKLQKILISLLAIPVIIYGVKFGQLHMEQSKVDGLNQKIAEIKDTESSIKMLETSVFNNTRIVTGLSNEQFPLHRFLLNLSLIVPEDLNIYNVTTDFMEKKIQTEQKEVASKVQSNATDNNSADNSSGSNSGSNTSSADTGGTQTPQTCINKDGTSADIGGTNPTQKADDKGNCVDLTDEERKLSEQKEIENKIISQKTMYVRGATISMNSLGKFVKDLEKNSYVESVDIGEVQNYYNAAQSYKIFELIVVLK